MQWINVHVPRRGGFSRFHRSILGRSDLPSNLWARREACSPGGKQRLLGYVACPWSPIRLRLQAYTLPANVSLLF